MFNTNILDVVIGLIFIYLLYSLLATTIQETISTFLHRRANILNDGIRSMLSDTKKDKGIVQNFLLFISWDFWLGLRPGFIRTFSGQKSPTLHNLFYDHPIIKNYGQNLFFKKPSYLTAENFSSILIETLKKIDIDAKASSDFELIKLIVERNAPKVKTPSVSIPIRTSVSFSASTYVVLDNTTIAMLTEEALASGIKIKFKRKHSRFFFWLANIFADNKIPYEAFASLPKGTTLSLSAGTSLPISAKTIVALNAEVLDKQLANPMPVKIDRETREILLYHLDEAAGDLNVFKFRIEKWFNDTMDRVSGWYKRNTQFYLLFLGLLLSITLNIDSIEITNLLSTNRAAREQMAALGVAAASNQRYNQGDKNSLAKEARDSIKADLRKVNTIVGLGWGDYGRKDKSFISSLKKDKPGCIANAFCWINGRCDVYKELNSYKIDSTNLDDLYNEHRFYLSLNYIYHKTNWKKFCGFIITALAISLGSTFWFDLLNKFVSLRTAVKTVDSSGSTTKNNSSDNNNTDG